MHAFIAAHWQVILYALGVWVLVATQVSQKYKRPATGWKSVAYLVFVDWPAYLPSLNGRTFFGLTFQVPFLTLSAHATAKPDEPNPVAK